MQRRDEIVIKKVISENLAEILSLEQDSIMSKLDKTSSYYVEIKKKVNEQDTNKVREFIKANSDLKISKSCIATLLMLPSISPTISHSVL